MQIHLKKKKDLINIFPWEEWFELMNPIKVYRHIVLNIQNCSFVQWLDLPDSGVFILELLETQSLHSGDLHSSHRETDWTSVELCQSPAYTVYFMFNIFV